MVDLKTLSERIIRSNKPGLGGQIGPDRPVILNRIRRSFSGGWNGHFEADRSAIFDIKESNDLKSIFVSIA